jgi:heme exporter protein A
VSRQAAWDALDAVGLDEIGHLPVRMLSQGQRKRAALARLWLDDKPRLWILDEPFTALDVQAVDLLCRKMDAHLAGGGIVIYTTHQEIALKTGRKLMLALGEVLP